MTVREVHSEVRRNTELMHTNLQETRRVECGEGGGREGSAGNDTNDTPNMAQGGMKQQVVK